MPEPTNDAPTKQKPEEPKADVAGAVEETPNTVEVIKEAPPAVTPPAPVPVLGEQSEHSALRR